MKLDLIRKKINELKKQEQKLLKGRAVYLDRVLKQLAAKGVTIEELNAHLKQKPGAALRKRKSSRAAEGSAVSDARSKVQVKYRDPSGNTWTGRGNAPKWLVEFERNGGKREELLVSRS